MSSLLGCHPPTRFTVPDLDTMANLGTFPGSTSIMDNINDLDGYTVRDYNLPSIHAFAPPQNDDFGFDPTTMQPSSLAGYQSYSAPTDVSFPEWPDLERDDDLNPSRVMSMSPVTYEMDKFINSSLPNSSTAVSRYGQMTPPRSHSVTGSAQIAENTSTKSPVPERRRRRRTKAQANAKELTPASTSTATTASRRKRKSTKMGSASTSKGNYPEEQKRKQSLEKNRLAAANCRMNKKEKTEQLQRDSREKAVQNTYLTDQIMHMKGEIQQMNALLLAHANCGECKVPEEIQAHLARLGSDYLNSHMGRGNSNFTDHSSQLTFSELPMMADSNLASSNDASAAS